MDRRDSSPAPPLWNAVNIVAPLFTLAMPFIRYRTGDIGQWSNSACPCGRPQRVIEKLMWRSGELYRTQDGRLVGPHFWCELFMQPPICEDMNEFQIVLCHNGAIRLRIVPRPSYSAETESKIRQYLRRNQCASLPVEFEYVERIEPHPSGKFQMVLSETSPRGETGTGPVLDVKAQFGSLAGCLEHRV